MSSHPGNLPWLDRLTAKLPDYAGYQASVARQSSDTAFRDALAFRLDEACAQIEQAIRQLVSRNAEREVETARRIEDQLRELAGRVRSAVIPDDFLRASEYEPARADSLHALDHALLERVDEIVHRASNPSFDGNWIAGLKSELDAFANKLDARTLLFNHYR